AKSAVDSWPAWLRRLRAEPAWPAAVVAADAGRRDWSVEDILQVPEALTEVIGVVESTLPEWGKEALRNSLPFLLECFVRESDPRAAALVGSLFNVLITDESLTIPSVEA